MTIGEALDFAEAFPEQMHALAESDPRILDLADALADALSLELIEYVFGIRDRGRVKSHLAAIRIERAGGPALGQSPSRALN